MVQDIVFFGVILWLLFGLFISFFSINRKIPKARLLKRTALAVALWLLPFSEEIYRYVGFEAICAWDSGFVKLTPVTTDSISLNGFTGPLETLEHPTISHTFSPSIYFIDGVRMNLWVSKYANPDLCDDDFTKALARQGVPNRDLSPGSELSTALQARRSIAQGFCYSDDPLPNRPKFEVGSDSASHQYYSWFFPLPIFEITYTLQDVETSELKSQFRTLSTLSNGILAKVFFENPGRNHCPLTSESSAPGYNSQLNFLSKAISGVSGDSI